LRPAGDQKAALRDLTHAVERGVGARQLSGFVSTTPALAGLAGSDGFESLLSRAPADPP
jgi:hypothetical protein